MRLYTKYKRLSQRRQNKWAGTAYVALTCGTLAFLGWLWWSQRFPERRTASPEPTNEIKQAQPSAPRATPSKPSQIVDAAPKNDSTGALRNATTSTNGPAPPVGIRSGTTNARVTAPSVAGGMTSGTNLPGSSVPPRSVSVPATVENNEVAAPTRWPKSILEVQIALARQAISCGSLDGKLGSQTRSAVRAFQEREHLPASGEPDAQTKALLPLLETPLTTYVITTNDLARLTPVGRTWLAKSQQERLDYETLLELVAEKGHAHPGLIRTLNRDVDWTNVTAGTAINIPNVRYPPRRAKAAYVTIHLSEKTLQVFDVSTNLLAHFPCSIAQRVEKRPVGQLFVEKLAPNPNYRFNPEVFPESAEARELGRILMIPPGPNNPVGTAWIGLNRPGYGIHGTPRPEEVGRTESHGCFRLANWNAEYLVQLVSVGTPVYVEP